jgi:hypothetical protein
MIRDPRREELIAASLWTIETIQTLDVLLSQLPKEPAEEIWVEEERMLKEILRIELGILKTQLWTAFTWTNWVR